MDVEPDKISFRSKERLGLTAVWWFFLGVEAAARRLFLWEAWRPCERGPGFCLGMWSDTLGKLADL